MKITHPKIVHSDDRGSIVDILENVEFNYATVIFSRKGVVRGNHYHKRTVQWVYVIRGQIQALARLPGEEVQVAILSPGDLLENSPGEEHTLVAIEDSEFLVLTSGVRGGQDYEKDTYRVQKPLEGEIS